MTIRPVKTQESALAESDSFRAGIEKPAGSGTASQSGPRAKPQKIIAVYLNPTHEHDWFKLADDLQTLESDGKIIWKCRTCSEITNTYDWRTP